jgi:predicted component of type VI protein secretion system
MQDGMIRSISSKREEPPPLELDALLREISEILVTQVASELLRQWLEMGCIVVPAMHRPFVHRLPNLYTAGGVDTLREFVKFKTLGTPFQVAILENPSTLALRIGDHLFVTQGKEVVWQGLSPVIHQLPIVRIIATKVPEIVGPAYASHEVM